jgi:hypothetical protein
MDETGSSSKASEEGFEIIYSAIVKLTSFLPALLTPGI